MSWLFQPIPEVVQQLAQQPLVVGAQTQPIHPGRHPGRFYAPSFQAGFVFPSTAIPRRGPVTAATLVFDFEDGGSVAYAWDTNVMRSRNGKETRAALINCPRETYAFSVYLGDGDVAFLQSELVANAAQGKPFAIALTHEAMTLSADAVGAVLTVTSTALLDWMYAGQSVAVLGPDGVTMATGVIQSFTSTTITLDVAPGSAGKLNGRVMPTIPCYLEETQSLGLYAVNVAKFELKARAIYFGNATSAWVPRGATVTTYTDPFTAQVYPVWDRGLDTADTSPRTLLTSITITDRGGVLLMTAPQTYADFGREIEFHAKGDADRQYLKAFHGACRGKQVAFLLPTWKPDLVPVSPAIASSVLVVHGNARGYADYAGQWVNSKAQQHLQILYTSGAVDYVTVSNAVDNLDGTESIQLDRGVTGTIARVSFLETCRFDTDDVVVAYTDGVGYSKLPCRVVQQ